MILFGHYGIPKFNPQDQIVVIAALKIVRIFLVFVLLKCLLQPGYSCHKVNYYDEYNVRKAQLYDFKIKVFSFVLRIKA